MTNGRNRRRSVKNVEVGFYSSWIYDCVICVVSFQRNSDGLCNSNLLKMGPKNDSSDFKINKIEKNRVGTRGIIDNMFRLLFFLS